MGLHITTNGVSRTVSKAYDDISSNFMRLQDIGTDSADFAVKKGPHESLLPELGWFDRIFRPYIKIQNGYLYFTTGNTKKIAQAMERFGWGKADSIGKLTEDELETFNRLLNSVDQTSRPIYKRTEDLFKIVKTYDRDVIDVALQRGKNVQEVAQTNKDFFMKMASEKLDSGEYKYSWSLCVEASKCDPKNEEGFNKLLAYSVSGDFRYPILHSEEIGNIARSKKDADFAVELLKRLTSKYPNEIVSIAELTKPGAKGWEKHYETVMRLMQDEELSARTIYVASRVKNLTPERLAAIKNLDSINPRILLPSSLRPGWLSSILTEEELGKATVAQVRQHLVAIKYLYENCMEDIPQYCKDIKFLKGCIDAGGYEAYSRKVMDDFMRRNNLPPIIPKNIASIGELFNLLSTKKIVKTLNSVDFNSDAFKNGLRMKYPQSLFKQDIMGVLDTCSPKDRQLIMHHCQFFIDDALRLSGLPRPNYQKLDGASEEVQTKLQEINKYINKFIYENEVELPENPELKKLMDTLIKAIPEFIPAIGRIQHGTHKYTLDIHILEVLKKCVNNPTYQELSAGDKTVVNISALLHDLGKAEAVVDEGHYDLCAIYAKSIVKKLKLPNSMSSKIVNLIQNHHWFAQIGDTRSAKSIAAEFRAPDELKMAKIIAKADLESVNDGFAKSVVRPYKYEKLKECEAFNDLIQSTGIPMSTTKLRAKLKPNVNAEGNMVIDLANDNDAYKYFAGARTNDDVRLLLHMTTGDTEAMDCARVACNNADIENIISSTYISKALKGTYQADVRPYGYVLEADMPNIILVSKGGLSSGTVGKRPSIEAYMEWDKLGNTRDFASKHICDRLEITSEEYVQLYKHIANIGNLEQINNVIFKNGKMIPVEKLPTETEVKKEGIKALCADRIKSVIKEFNDSLLNEVGNNEILIVKPNVKGICAMVDSIDLVDNGIKEYAKKYNLPIIILGKSGKKVSKKISGKK